MAKRQRRDARAAIAATRRANADALRCRSNATTRLSRPLRDRFDLVIEVPAVPAMHLREAPAGEPSVEIRGRVVASRERQRARLAGHRLHTNGEIQGRLIWQYCRPDAAGFCLLDAVSRLTLSARA